MDPPFVSIAGRGATRWFEPALRHAPAILGRENEWDNWARGCSDGGYVVRKPALDLSDIVGRPCKPEHRGEGIGGTVTGIARPRRAVKPQRRSARAAGAGVDGESAD